MNCPNCDKNDIRVVTKNQRHYLVCFGCDHRLREIPDASARQQTPKEREIRKRWADVTPGSLGESWVRSYALSDILALFEILDKLWDKVELLRTERKTALDDVDEYDTTNRRLSELLTGVANVLKGPPPELTLHSWHDLPEVAAELLRGIEAQAHPFIICNGKRYTHNDILELYRETNRWASRVRLVEARMSEIRRIAAGED